jgi:hypothetical protein
MTQEELDALMNGDIGDSEFSAEENVLDSSETLPTGYNEKTAHHWPLPATDENRMVHQLDDVAKESEEKTSEIFDIIEGINNDLVGNEENANSVMEVLNSNIKLFTTLSEKFPDVEAFKTQLEKNNSAQTKITGSMETLKSSEDSIMNIMDIMQYQDIHRQKIERVINVMRSLSRYMNTLFEGKIDDERRVSSAQHIAGDTHRELVSNDEIEALLEQFGT